MRSITAGSVLPVAVIRRSTRGGSWEFPLVFDYRFLHRRVSPYAGGGSIVGQTMSGVSELQATFNTGRMDRQFIQFTSIDNQFPAYIANAGVEVNTTRVVIRCDTPVGTTQTENLQDGGIKSSFWSDSQCDEVSTFLSASRRARESFRPARPL
jgi:hypothetical protein